MTAPPDLCLDPMTPEMSAAIIELRARLGDDVPLEPESLGVGSDDMLLRFLRAHQFNVGEAVIWYRKALKLRKDNDLDDLRRKIVDAGIERVTELEGYGIVSKHQYFGTMIVPTTSVEGFPIEFRLLGLIQPDELLTNVGWEKIKAFHLAHMELKSYGMHVASSKNGILTRYVCVMDCAGLGVRHLRPKFYSCIHRIMKLTQQLYPEM